MAFDKFRRRRRIGGKGVLLAGAVLAASAYGTNRFVQNMGGTDNIVKNARSYWSGVGEKLQDGAQGFFRTDPAEFTEQVQELRERFSRVLQDYSRSLQRGDFEGKLQQGVEQLDQLSRQMAGYLGHDARTKRLLDKNGLGEFQGYLTELGKQMPEDTFVGYLSKTDEIVAGFYPTELRRARVVDQFLGVAQGLSAEGYSAVRQELRKRTPGQRVYDTDVQELQEAGKPVRRRAFEALTDSLAAASPKDGLEAAVYAVNKVPEQERTAMVTKIVEGLSAEQRKGVQQYVCPAVPQAGVEKLSAPVASQSIFDKYHNWFGER